MYLPYLHCPNKKWINSKKGAWQFLPVSNMAGRLIAGLGMNMQRWRWFTSAGIKGQWMESLARCTVMPGTREDEYNTSSIVQSLWSRTSSSMSRTAVKPGLCGSITLTSSPWASPQYLQLQFLWSPLPQSSPLYSFPCHISSSSHAPLTASYSVTLCS